MRKSPKKTVTGAVKSMTIWFNGVVGTALVALPLIQDSLPQLQAYLSADDYKALVGVMVVGNIVLRVKTAKPLNEK